MDEPPNVRLDLASRPRNLVLVRQTLTGLAEAISLNGAELGDILTAVTEACNNVALHAYDGLEGPLNVKVKVAPEAMRVVVGDQGSGIRAFDINPKGGFRIGLPVMRALARRVELRDAAGHGTEVEMEFNTAPTRPLEPCTEDSSRFPRLGRMGALNTTAVTMAPVSLARTIAPRLLCVLASHADFSTDRISDVQLVADVLAAHLPAVLNTGHLNLTVSIEPHELELTLGPLCNDGARQLIADSHLEGLGGVIERLTDRHCVAAAGRYETLTLQLIDRRR